MTQIRDLGREGPRYGVLGPLQVVTDGRDVAVTSLLQRKIVTALLLSPQSVVSTDALEFILWGDQPPKTARQTLHTLVSRLRSTLPDGQIVTQPPGYLIAVEDAQIDAVLFERLVHEADSMMTSDVGTSLRLIDQGLELWRGDAIAEFADEEFAMAEAHRLDELRLVATEMRFDALLGLGRHESVIPELDGFIEKYPFRERPRQRLMTALYRSGRTSDALDVYRDFRQLMRDELGLETSCELQDLELRILNRDASLGSITPAASLQPWAPPQKRLPRPPVLLGRQGELDRLAEMTRQPLTTVIGPGGVGKTSLVSVWAGSQSDVAIVELADLPPDGNLVVGLAEQLGMDALTGDPLASLIGRLAALGGTLVLDSCEHLLDAVRTFVANLGRLAPEVQVVCTSRQRLGLPGELVLRLEPLPLAGDLIDPGDLRANEAVRLFLDRVHRADSALRIDEVDLRVVAEICRLVDGLPLAIELAAARAPVYGIADLAEQLATDLSVLEQGGGRQRSVVDVLEWSIGLLDVETRHVLATAALFEGGFRLDDLADVHAGGNATVSVGRLVDASLAYRVLDSHPSRFRLHAPTRIHARRSLHTPVETERRFVAWGHALVGGDSRSSRLLGDFESRKRLIAEAANVRAAAKTALALGERATAFEMAELLGGADLIDTPAVPGLIDEIADAYEASDGRIAIGVLAAGARVSALWGRIDEALQRADEAESIAAGRRHRSLCMAAHARAIACVFRGRPDRSIEILGSIAADESVPARERVVAALGRAEVIGQTGDADRALAMATEAYERSLVAAGESVVAYGHQVLGTIELCRDPSIALESFDAAIHHAERAQALLVRHEAQVHRIAALMLADRDIEALHEVRALVDSLVQGGNRAQFVNLIRVAATLAMRAGDLETAALLAHAYDARAVAARFGTIVNATRQIDELATSFLPTEWRDLQRRACALTEREVVDLVHELTILPIDAAPRRPGGHT